MSLTSSLASVRRYRVRRKEAHMIRPANPRPQRRDCQGQLLAALQEIAGPDAAIADASMRPWCSATFVGAQHRIVLHLSGDDAAQHGTALTARLREAEFALRGHIIADMCVDDMRSEADGRVLLSLGVLTIEDW